MSREYKDVVMPFGSHKGKLICDIPDNYLDWIIGEGWFREKCPLVAEMIKKELEYRKKWNIRIK